MPAAEIDRTTPPSDSGSVRQLGGCLTYRGLDPSTQPDFNRTAEDWSSLNMPLWVVSARVRDCFLQHKFRGWAFRPVLDGGSRMHQEYQHLWSDLFALVSANPRNFF